VQNYILFFENQKYLRTFAAFYGRFKRKDSQGTFLGNAEQ
jgi:hypothetical protein